MFKNILFATSATEPCDYAARVAFDMCRRYDSHLHLFHVLGVPTRGYSQVVIDVKSKENVMVDDEYIAWVTDEVAQYYETLLENVKDRCKIEVRVGFPHREILRTARDTAPDLIIMGGSTGSFNDSVYKKMVTGSTFQRVAGAVQCPILVVTRPAASFWGGFSRIVFGTDFSSAADAAFEYALTLAMTLDCELLLFHALDISHSLMSGVISQDDIEEKLRSILCRLRGRYGPRMKAFKNYAIDAWEGIPAVEIVKYARERQADLIVMAHHAGKTADEQEMPMGGTMEQVIVRAGCPVLSINRRTGK